MTASSCLSIVVWISFFWIAIVVDYASASVAAGGVPIVDMTGVNKAPPIQELWSSLWSSLTPKKDYKALLNHEIIPESDLRDTNRTIWIITTASLPWMTGTSINPLLRAAYLAKDRPEGKVYLMIPWLPREEQDLAYTPGIRFKTPEEQRKYVLDWLTNEAELPQAAEKITIIFYSGRFHDDFHSIFPMGDITALIPDELADVCVLEEPEHLNWYKAPFTAKAWMDKFKHVVGIIHTNYVTYSHSIAFGQLKGSFLYFINQGVCRAYCHKIIKLSGALQEFAAEKEVICNVHGVRGKFLDVGDRALTKKFTKGAYFIGKMAWPKGLNELFQLMKYVSKRTGKSFPIDLYGQGPHLREIKEAAERFKLPTTFFGAKDHLKLEEYRVFVNPSLSEVLCTTIVEALAMGKWVVCAKHPSNDFFAQFPNCLFFSNEEEFAANVYWALNHDPQPLTKEQRYALSWEAATERFLQASMITKDMLMKSNSFTDKFLAWMLEVIGTGSHGDTLRSIAGAGSAANQIEYLTRYGTALPLVDEEDLSEDDKRELKESFQEVLEAVRNSGGKKDDDKEPISEPSAASTVSTTFVHPADSGFSGTTTILPVAADAFNVWGESSTAKNDEREELVAPEVKTSSASSLSSDVTGEGSPQ